MDSSLARELEDRLVRYCIIDTQADESSTTTPSTQKQFDLLNLLVDELKQLGVSDVSLTSYGAVIGTIPANVRVRCQRLAFWPTSTHRPASMRPELSRSCIEHGMVLTSSFRTIRSSSYPGASIHTWP